MQRLAGSNMIQNGGKKKEKLSLLLPFKKVARNRVYDPDPEI